MKIKFIVIITVLATAIICSAGFVKAETANLLNTGAITGAISQAQTFANGIITSKIYPATNSTTAVQINKADGSANVLNVDTINGRIGIGNTSPSFLLDVGNNTFAGPAYVRVNSATDRAAGFTIANAGTTNWYIYKPNDNSGDLRFGRTNNGQSKTLDSLIIKQDTGNIGIGTSTPNNLLQVANLIDFNNTDKNTKLGYQAGLNIVSGAKYNTFVGYQAGLSAITGGDTNANNNSALGFQTLLSNITGNDNVAIGSAALKFNTTGSGNTAVGGIALGSNTTGSENVSIGVDSLMINSTGSENVAVGVSSLSYNTGGSYNTAIGKRTLYTNSTGQYNTAIGYTALLNSTTGNNNIAIGYYTLGGRANTGNYNTAIGDSALLTNTTGGNNTSIGNRAMTSNIGGSYNTANGMNALFGNTTGNLNTAIGFNSLQNNSTGSSNVAIGNYAGAYEMGSNSFYVDNQDRQDSAGDKAGALLYGTFNATPKNQTLHINGVTFPLQASTSSAPAYVKGGVYFNTTLNKLMVGGATGWEVVTSVPAK